MHWQGTSGSEPTASEFFIWVQRYLKNQVNDHHRQLEPIVNTVLVRQAARERLMEEVAAYMRTQIGVLEAQVRSLVSQEESSLIDWEPTAPILAPVFQAGIDQRIQAGIFNVLQLTPSMPPPIPPSIVRQAPRQGLGTETSQPAPPFAPRPPPPPPPPQEPPSFSPPPPVQNIFETPTPQPRVVYVHQQAPAGQAQVPAPPQGQAPVGDEQSQRELDEMRRRHDKEVQQLMARAGLAAGGVGAGGGGGGQQPPRVAGGGGGDPDPDSDADSDP